MLKRTSPAWLQTLQRLGTSQSSKKVVESSIALRVSVQTLVTVGILATDGAANLHNGIWAVPLSFAGAFWSYRQRRQRNLIAKFGIAIGMLLVLFLFLSRLVTQLGDARVALAELLIQLQVLHTFDMPRRKDLGYSAVIGLILLGVAATISETMLFGGFLLLFLILALLVLSLDYRSRLGIITAPRMSLAPQAVLRVLAVLGLGLAVFALLPRLPGYQFRTFPVSNPIEFQGQFDGQRIVNPGYRGNQTRAGEGGQTFAGAGETPAFNSEFYAGFNQTLNQNLRGTLTPKVVMRVRSQIAGFWRVLSFDQYTGQGWTLARNDQTQTLKRPAWSYRFLVPPRTQQGASRDIVQTYSILADFPNLIPALSQPKEVYFPTREIAIDLDGNLRSPVPLEEGLTYTVISEVPYRDRTQLGQASLDYPDSIRQVYLQIPNEIQDPVRQQAQTLLAQANQPPTSTYETALFLAQAIKQTYRLQPDIPPLAADQDLVSTFLFEFEGGYPDHFSTTLTVMLRSLGIPARLTTGLGPGEFNPWTGLYVVKNTDAYAVTEVYFPRYGWFAFDPIPGHALLPPSVEQAQTFSVLRQVWNWVAGWLPSPVTGWLSGLFVALTTAITSLFGRLSGWQGLGVGLLLGLGLLFCGWCVQQLWRVWRYRQWLSTLPPMMRLYQQMLDYLKLQGWPKRSQQTPQEYVQQIQQHSPTLAGIVADISQAYVGWRYGKHPANLPHLKRQLRALKTRRTKVNQRLQR